MSNLLAREQELRSVIE